MLRILTEPSPQRTPVLYQAGSSTRGREFAATHAECVFVFGADKHITRDIVVDIRGRAAAHGRDPRDILIFYNRAAVVGRTRREAEEKYREYHEHAASRGRSRISRVRPVSTYRATNWTSQSVM